MNQRPCVLSVNHISVTFRQYEGMFRQIELPVIRDLNLSVREGEMVAVVGSSGSGKSLLAHAILNLLPYNASVDGEIRFDGEILDEKKIKEIRGRQIVLVPQSVSYMDPLMKTGSQVWGEDRLPEKRIRGQEALRRYGLGAETEELYPFELSGGMARRVLIASAVMQKPRLVIADEPTPGLHIEAARRVLSHFKEMAEEGAGVLLITHDLELALTYADRIVVFYAGTEVEEALAEDFGEEAKLRHPYTKALYRAMPQHGFQSVKGCQPYVKDMPVGCLYAPRCPYAEKVCSQGLVESRELRGGTVRCHKAV